MTAEKLHSDATNRQPLEQGGISNIHFESSADSRGSLDFVRNQGEQRAVKSAELEQCGVLGRCRITSSEGGSAGDAKNGLPGSAKLDSPGDSNGEKFTPGLKKGQGPFDAFRAGGSSSREAEDKAYQVLEGTGRMVFRQGEQFKINTDGSVTTRKEDRKGDYSETTSRDGHRVSERTGDKAGNWTQKDFDEKGTEKVLTGKQIPDSDIRPAPPQRPVEPPKLPVEPPVTNLDAPVTKLDPPVQSPELRADKSEPRDQLVPPKMTEFGGVQPSGYIPGGGGINGGKYDYHDRKAPTTSDFFKRGADYVAVAMDKSAHVKDGQLFYSPELDKKYSNELAQKYPDQKPEDRHMWLRATDTGSAFNNTWPNGRGPSRVDIAVDNGREADRISEHGPAAKNPDDAISLRMMPESDYSRVTALAKVPTRPGKDQVSGLDFGYRDEHPKPERIITGDGKPIPTPPPGEHRGKEIGAPSDTEHRHRGQGHDHGPRGHGHRRHGKAVAG